MSFSKLHLVSWVLFGLGCVC